MVRLLLAEDDADMLAVLQTRLESQGWSVEIAANGEEALYKIRTSSFDAVLLDAVMPLQDGFKVLKALRSDPKTKLLPVLILSSSEETLEQAGRKLYPADKRVFLVEPLGFQELVSKITEVTGDGKTGDSG